MQPTSLLTNLPTTWRLLRAPALMALGTAALIAVASGLALTGPSFDLSPGAEAATPIGLGETAAPQARDLTLAVFSPAPLPAVSRIQIGKASWYRFHKGTKTASGERFDQSKMTAAHRTLPLGTQVAVTNLENGKKVEVRINDRGPYVKGRILDLTKGAAKALGIDHGLAQVRVETVAAE